MFGDTDSVTGVLPLNTVVPMKICSVCGSVLATEVCLMSDHAFSVLCLPCVRRWEFLRRRLCAVTLTWRAVNPGCVRKLFS